MGLLAGGVISASALTAATPVLGQGMTAAAPPPSAAGQAPSGMAADPLLAQRQASLPQARPRPIDWFQPQQTVMGASRGHPGAARLRTIDPAAMADARDWAMAHGTQALLVWRDGNLEEATYAPDVSPAQRLNSYYMHFTVLSLAYGIAIHDGLIKSVDEPIGNYLPEWRNDPRGKITIRQGLQMSAGLETYHDNKDPRNRNTRIFLGSDSTTPAFEFPLVNPPGTVFAYNYMVPELMGIVFQRAIRQPYATYLSQHLWRPLGNADAAVWLDHPGGRPHFNSALFATAEDWLNIGKLILNEGRAGGRQVVPADWIRTMKTPSPVNPNYGMIWIGSPYAAVRPLAADVDYKMHSSAPYLADDIVFLDGYGGQRVWIVPSRKLVIVRIGATLRDWDDAPLPNMILKGLK